MKIVILGGAGFLGRNLASHFKKNKADVLVLDRPGVDVSYLDQKQIPCAGCDFATAAGIEQYIDEGDCVIHLVSTSYPTTSNADVAKDAEDNIIPTLRLLDVCVKKKAARVIYASSGGQVYGIPQYVPIDESHPTNPRSAYGVHKLAIEKYLALYTELYGLSTIALRISNPFGYGQQPFRGQGVVPTFIASVYKGIPVEVWGDGESVRDYIDVEDMALAFEKAVSYTGTHKVFNIGSGCGVSVNEILRTVEEVTGITAVVNRKEAAVEDVRQNILSCKLAEEELGWKSTTTLKQGIEKLCKCWDEATKSFREV